MIKHKSAPIDLALRFYLAGTLAFMAGCYRAGYVGPFKPSGAALAPGAAAAILGPASSQLASFRALYRARIDSGNRTSTLRYGLAFKYPNRLKLDVLPLNGAYALASLVDDGRGVIYREGGKRTEEFSDSREAILKYFGLPLSSTEAAAILSRKIPGLSSGFVCYSASGSVCVDSAAAKVAFFNEEGELTSFELRNKELTRIFLKASYQGQDLDIWLPKESVRVELIQIQRKADDAIPDSLFGF